MYSNTGAMSWLSYAVGTVMLLFVAFNLNQFAAKDPQWILPKDWVYRMPGENQGSHLLTACCPRRHHYNVALMVTRLVVF
jgi:uncharacterized membrane protein YdcZ (DUF606 family)